MPKNDFKIEGLDEAVKFLATLDNKVNKQVMNRGLSKTGAIIKKDMKRNLATGRGGARLAKNIKLWQGKRTKRALKFIGWKLERTRTDKQKESRQKRLDAGSGKTDRARQTWADMGAYWLEFGTMELMTIPRARGTRALSVAQKKAGSRGRIAPIRWFGKAVDTSVEPMVNDFSKNMGKAIDDHIKRTLKKVS